MLIHPLFYVCVNIQVGCLCSVIIIIIIIILLLLEGLLQNFHETPII